MTYANQFDYDNARESSLSSYQDEPMFADFAEYVTLEILAGRDCMGIDALIIMIDLECLGGGYQMAVKWVCDRVTEEQFNEWISDY